MTPITAIQLDDVVVREIVLVIHLAIYMNDIVVVDIVLITSATIRVVIVAITAVITDDRVTMLAYPVTIALGYTLIAVIALVTTGLVCRAVSLIATILATLTDKGNPLAVRASHEVYILDITIEVWCYELIAVIDVQELKPLPIACLGVALLGEPCFHVVIAVRELGAPEICAHIGHVVVID
jgi:hypothetical protein